MRRTMRESDLGPASLLPGTVTYFEPEGDKIAKLKALIRSSEIKAVVCNGLGKRLQPGMDDKQTAGAKIRHFYMIDSLKVDEILNA